MPQLLEETYELAEGGTLTLALEWRPLLHVHVREGACV